MIVEIVDLNTLNENEMKSSFPSHFCSSNISLFPGFLKAVLDTFRLKGIYLTCLDNKIPVGVAALYEKLNLTGGKTLVSVPGGFWAKDRDAEIEMINTIKSYINKKRIKGPVFCDLQNPLFTLDSQNRYYRAVKYIDGDEQATISTFSKNIRRDYKTAVKNGLKLVESDDSGVFYKIWGENMRYLGTPPVPHDFFLNLKKYLQEKVQILLVQKDNHINGGAFVIRYGDYAIDLYASSLKSYFMHYPNIFLYYEMIVWACRNGIKTFDLGRSQPGSGNEKFKLRFRAELTPLYTYPGITKGGVSTMFNFIFAETWKYMPLKMSNLIGPRLRRYIPFG